GTRVAFLGFVVLSLMFVDHAAGQVKQRLIPFPEWATSSDEDDEVPLELVEIRVGGQTVILGQSFTADSNWLKKITLRVKNIS
ncbi:hypothetical protein, partial [Escherichia coli]|uniref:hypothetical protein n=1 Tax=Escherichia coli TaxID=562 RepID=UPI00215B5A3F